MALPAIAAIAFAIGLIGCGGEEEDVPRTHSSNNYPPSKDLPPELRLESEYPHEVRYTSTDFGNQHINTNTLRVFNDYCYLPTKIHYELFDPNGDSTRLVALLSQQEGWTSVPVESESDPDLLVEPVNVEKLPAYEEFLQLSADHYILESDETSGTFSFFPQYPYNQQDWWIVVYFAAYDGELFSRALRAELNFRCDPENP